MRSGLGRVFLACPRPCSRGASSSTSSGGRGGDEAGPSREDFVAEVAPVLILRREAVRGRPCCTCPRSRCCDPARHGSRDPRPLLVVDLCEAHGGQSVTRVRKIELEVASGCTKANEAEGAVHEVSYLCEDRGDVIGEEALEQRLGVGRVPHAGQQLREELHLLQAIL